MPQRETLDLLAQALDLSPEDQAQWERARKRLSRRAGDMSTRTPRAGHPLPAPFTSFVGRERETAEIADLLRKLDTRLLTLTGAGGIGKTRLGIKAAESLTGEFTHGVFFVPLAPLAHPDLIPAAMAQTLGVRAGTDQTLLQGISTYLRGRSVVLVLDNFEHVVSGAVVVGTLLEECPDLKVLATSRVPLRLRGEREFHVRSLDEDAATALFIQRSSDVRPGFQAVDGHLEAITEICRRLDGLPLAIELAAARSKVLPPQALLCRLERPLDILTSGPRDLPARQQTLRNTIAWSYDLLQPEEQALFRSLAVFMGGFTLEAAEAVGEGDVLEALTSLIESNLVEPHGEIGGEPRFRMLETIREFGIELLEAGGTEPDARERHARYMVDLVTSAPPFIIGPDQIEWLNRIEAEHANILTALDWLLDRDVEAGLRTLGVMWSFWWLRTPLTVGRQYFDRFLERADDSVDPATLALALTGAGIITEFESDFAWGRAAVLHEQALSIWLDLHDPPEGAYWSYLNLGGIAERKGDLDEAEARFLQTLEYARCHNQTIGTIVGLLRLGNLASSRGQMERATKCYRDGLVLARELGDPFTIAAHTGSLGRLLVLDGRFDEARLHMTESLALERAVKLTRHIASSLENLAGLELRQGRFDKAAPLFRESLREAHLVNSTAAVGFAQFGLGKVALKLGNVTDAFALFRQSVDSFRSSGEHSGLARVIEALAVARTQSGDFEEAARLHAWVATYRERMGIPPKPDMLPDLERNYATLRQSLTESEFDAAWEAGARLTLDGLLEEAAGGTGRLQGARNS